MSQLSEANNAKDIIMNAVRRGKLPWTPRAQAVLKHAEKLARKDGFNLVGTEHLVFGLVSVKECLGAAILKNLGLTASEYVRHYEKLRSSSPDEGTGETRFSEDIDKVIQHAYEQSSQWCHTYIGAEHLLAGTLLARTGQGFHILSALGITLQRVRDETAKSIVCNKAQTEGKEE